MESRSKNIIRIPLMGAFILVCLLFAPVTHAQQVVEVVVRGSGATMEDARHDAIRQATQQVAQQLIIADRRIKDDTVVMDRVLSTMNGYVEKFDLLGSGSDANGTWLEARIIMSESRIENFIAEVRGSGSRVDGQSIFAELQRANVQRGSAEEIMRRAFQGYPHAALKAKVISVRVGNGKMANHLLMNVVIESDPAWAASANELIKSISNSSISLRGSRGADWYYSGDRCVKGRLLGYGGREGMFQLGGDGFHRCGNKDFWTLLGGEKLPLCFVHERGAECHVVPRDLKSSLVPVLWHSLDIIVEFVGDDWRTTKRSRACLMAQGNVGKDALTFPEDRVIGNTQNQRPSLVSFMGSGYRGGGSLHGSADFVYTGKIHATYVVGLDSFDLDATRTVVVVPVLSALGENNIIHDMSGGDEFDCNMLMSEAINAYRAKK